MERGRLPGRVPDYLAGRSADEAHDDALPQPDGDGRRGMPAGLYKTTPAMLMGAASADIPAVMVTGGPMLSGKWRAEELGSGTDVWRLWAERRAGRLRGRTPSNSKTPRARRTASTARTERNDRVGGLKLTDSATVYARQPRIHS